MFTCMYIDRLNAVLLHLLILITKNDSKICMYIHKEHKHKHECVAVTLLLCFAVSAMTMRK